MNKLNKSLCFFNCFGTFGTCFLVFSFLILSLTSGSSTPSPHIWNLSDANPTFVGREEQLQKLASFFKPGAKKIAAITGGPGFGKTQTAKQFAQKFRVSYDIIWWFDANQDISNQYEKLALKLNRILPKEEQIVPAKLSKDALVDILKDILRIKNIKWLLIFDNAESYAELEKFIPVTHNQPGKHILLTSRNATIWPDKVDIGKFKRSESLQFVKQALPQETDTNIEKLAETLSDYPLGLTIAAAFIKTHSPTTIPKYLSLYLTRTVKKADPFIKTADPLLEGYANDAQTPLAISLKFIEQQSQEALNTLFFMSLLNSKDIPESYIDIWLEKTKAKLSSAEVIKMMNDQSLIEIKTMYKDNDPEPTHFFSLHDLIHQLIQESIPMENKRKLIDEATKVMLEVFAGPFEIFVAKIARDPIHLLQAQKLCKSAKEASYSSSDLLKLKVCLFQCFMNGTRDFEAARMIREEIDADLKAGITLPLYYEALLKFSEGFLDAIATHYDDAIQHMKEAFSLFEASGDHRNEIFCSLINLVQYYIMRGEIERAEPLIRQGEEMFKTSTSLISNGGFLYVLSLALIDQGKFREAEETINKMEAYPTLSEESPAIYHGLLLQKATVLIKQGKLPEALKVLETCEAKTNAFFQGRNNTSLSNILLLKSLISIKKKESSLELLQNLEKALLIFNDFYQGEKKQRRQAYTYFIIGKASDHKKDFKKALENYLISDEIYNNVLKEKKIDDVSELYKEMVILGARMKDEAIVHEYLKAHIQTFGRMHPRTKEILLFLNQNGLTVPL
ncbi:MAG: ATP-binding protein [Alphaproteobacteria bacterium]|nr:ATP-binding protein [Alphaproteobacteria bacterium]